MFSLLNSLNSWTLMDPGPDLEPDSGQGQPNLQPPSPPSSTPGVGNSGSGQLGQVQTPASPPPTPAPLDDRWKGLASPPSSSVLLTPVPAPPPMLPGWNRSLQKANLAALRFSLPFIQIPVDGQSEEYKVIQKLLEGTSLEMTSLERVVNPGLWKRFVRTWADLLESKSNDIRLLTELGLTKEEIAQKTGEAATLGFEGSSFSENMVLLFHGTKGHEAFHDILCDGLDERLASTNGALGRGIYLSDCPERASHLDKIGVLIIYAVMLGDCLEVQDDPKVPKEVNSSTVREPMKAEAQQRNPTDRFFDSIVCRRDPSRLPIGITVANEFVIFNRALCCPLYSVHYVKKEAKTSTPSIPPLSSLFNLCGKEPETIPGETAAARAQIPSFAWTKSRCQPQEGEPGSGPDPTMTTPDPSPFYAATIFKAMTESTIQDEKIRLQLVQLARLGFTNMTVNKRVLHMHAFDLTKAAKYLLKEEEDTTASEFEGQECDICHTRYPVTSVTWEATGHTGTGAGYFVTLPCSPHHKMCISCVKRLATTGITMSKQTHSLIKCPFCQTISGSEIQIGDCPDGYMDDTKVEATITNTEPQSEIRTGFGWIKISYRIFTALYYLDRTAYLPNTSEGQVVLELLRTAWDRRLIFKIVTSATTGQGNVLVWNIPHKTSLTGGEAEFGYPDPTYLQRVRERLAHYGIQ